MYIQAVPSTLFHTKVKIWFVPYVRNSKHALWTTRLPSSTQNECRKRMCGMKTEAGAAPNQLSVKKTGEFKASAFTFFFSVLRKPG